MVMEVYASILLGISDEEANDSSWTCGGGGGDVKFCPVVLHNSLLWEISYSETLPEGFDGL